MCLYICINKDINVVRNSNKLFEEIYINSGKNGYSLNATKPKYNFQKTPKYF